MVRLRAPPTKPTQFAPNDRKKRGNKQGRQTGRQSIQFSSIFAVEQGTTQQKAISPQTSPFSSQNERNVKRGGRLGFSSTPKMPSTSPHVHHLILLLSITLFLLLISPSRSHDPNQPQQEQEQEQEQDNICPSLSDASRSLSDSGSGSGSGSSSCNINCFRPDPVCGVNGVTYWCGCPEAACAGVQVAKRGFCQVGNGSSSTISGQAFLLLHIVWLILLGFSVLCGFL